MKIAQPEPKRRSALLNRPTSPTSSAWRRAVQIRSAKPRGALERAVLVEDDARCDQRGPGQQVGEALGAVAIFGEVQHGGASRVQVLRVA